MRYLIFIVMILILLVLMAADSWGAETDFTQSDREFNTWIVLFVGIVAMILVFCTIYYRGIAAIRSLNKKTVNSIVK